MLTRKNKWMLSATGAAALFLALGLAIVPTSAGAATVGNATAAGGTPNISISVCTNTVDVIAALNPLFHNRCINVNL
jgi:hypothetical protein